MLGEAAAPTKRRAKLDAPQRTLKQNTLQKRCVLSGPGGELFCEQVKDRVKMGGRAIKYREGFIDVPEHFAP